jgi:hypothetical protein
MAVHGRWTFVLGAASPTSERYRTRAQPRRRLQYQCVTFSRAVPLPAGMLDLALYERAAALHVDALLHRM